MTQLVSYLVRFWYAAFNVPTYTCWHCGEWFTDAMAASHFGERERDKAKRMERPACIEHTGE